MTFTVVTDRVRSVASEIDRLAAHFDDVANRRVGYTGYADAAPVEHGLHEFFGKWTHGMADLHEELSSLARHLHDAAGAYEDTERSLGEAAAGSS